MRISRTFTFSAYSRVRRHDMERALSFAVAGPFTLAVTFWEWSWSFGFGHDDVVSFYGPYISYQKPRGECPGYWIVALSTNLWWESA